MKRTEVLFPLTELYGGGVDVRFHNERKDLFMDYTNLLIKRDGDIFAETIKNERGRNGND